MTEQTMIAPSAAVLTAQVKKFRPSRRRMISFAVVLQHHYAAAGYDR
jgi:hypothetical protein